MRMGDASQRASPVLDLEGDAIPPRGPDIAAVPALVGRRVSPLTLDQAAGSSRLGKRGAATGRVGYLAR